MKQSNRAPKPMPPFLRRLLYPPTPVVWLMVLVAAAWLTLVFTRDWESHPLGYTGYLFSCYALVSFCLALPRWGRWWKQTRLVQFIRHHPLWRRYWADLAFRGEVSLYIGLAANLLFVLFKAYTGWRYSSIWFFAIAMYYLALVLLRLVLLYGLHRHHVNETTHQRALREVKVYRRTGWLMFYLNIAMTGMVVQMVRDNRSYTYPGSVIYLSALYAFYAIITAVMNLFRYRRLGSALLSASKVVSFAGAMMSILSLQTAMMSQFGPKSSNFAKLMNTITGTVVLACCFGLAVFMVVSGRRRLKQLQDDAIYNNREDINQ